MLVVDAQGHRGGLVLLWTDHVDIEVTSYSQNHIDASVVLDAGSPKWCFTGIYSFPEWQRRQESSNMLRTLIGLSTLPWIVMGDFNDLLNQSEKQGRLPHPDW